LSPFISLLKTVFLSRKSADLVHPAAIVNPGEQTVELAKDKFNAGDLLGAVEICSEYLAQFPTDTEARREISELQFDSCIKAAEKQFPGPSYLDWLAWFHKTLKPETYLEIGVESGRSLNFAAPPTRAVGVDPAIQIVHSQETWVKLFKLASDAFFASHDLRNVFGAPAVDLVFIDGLHTFDQALKDFINAERFSHERSIVLFHDIFPVVPATASRERETRFWVGDTWKVMVILKKYRPDLTIHTIPTFPSGLGVVTNLNARSTVLSGDFEAISKEAMRFDLEDYLPDIADHLNRVENAFTSVERLLELNPP
jgi:hypothetical protein